MWFVSEIICDELAKCEGNVQNCPYHFCPGDRDKKQFTLKKTEVRNWNYISNSD